MQEGKISGGNAADKRASKMSGKAKQVGK